MYHISQVQILSHQSKIASRIELSTVSDPNNRDNFKRLGYLSLDSNERSGHKLRELKSVYVDTNAIFVKLLIRKCHVNNHNLFNQVSIIAINILGNAAERPGLAGPWDDGLSMDMELDPVSVQMIRDLSARKARAIEVEDYDEAKRLKVAIESLKKAGSLIADLERKKKHAVSMEDFDTAKAIKLQIDQLRQNTSFSPTAASSSPYGAANNGGHYGQPPPQRGGGAGVYGNGGPVDAGYGAPRTGSARGGHSSHHHHGAPPASNPYDVYDNGVPPETNRALSSHSHHTANHHEAMERERDRPPSVQRPPSNAYDDRPIKPKGNDIYGDMAYDPDAAADPYGANPNPSPNVGDDRPLKGKGSYAIDGDFLPEDRPLNTHNPNDDRPLPASNASEKNPFGSKGPTEQPTGNTSLPDPEPLSANTRKDGDYLTPIFEEYPTLCLLSKNWQLREHALTHIHKELVSFHYAADDKTLFNGLNRVLSLSLRDKVAKVFISACTLTKAYVDRFSADLPQDLGRHVPSCITDLTARLSDSNTRVRSTAVETLQMMATNEAIGCAPVSEALLRPLKKKEVGKPIPLLSRCELLSDLLTQFSLSSAHGLLLHPLVEFVLPILEHRDAKVRSAAIALTTSIYLIAGPKKMMPHLKGLRQGLKDSLNASFADHGGDALPNAAAAPTPPAAAKKKSGADKKGGRSGAGAGASKGGKKGPEKKGGKKKKIPARRAPSPEPDSPGIIDDSLEQEGEQGSDDEEVQLDEGFCQFCGVEDPTLTEDKLDMHYWQVCPMLASCKQCEQVIEIPTLAQHLLGECEVEGTHKQCPRCEEPIRVSVYNNHVKKGACPPSQPLEKFNRCPLCHQDVPPGPDGWKQHLLVDKCPKNPRTK